MYWSNKRQHFSWIVCILFNVIGGCAAIDQNRSTDGRRLVPAAATPPEGEISPHTFPKQKQVIIRYQIKKASASEGDVTPLDNKQPVIGTETEHSSPPDDDEEEVDILVSDELKYAETLYQSGLMLRKRSVRDESEKAYRLFQEAAQLGHIGAKEELATAHLFGVYLPVDFHRAERYFQEGAEMGSSASHYGLYFMHSVGFIPGASIAQALLHLNMAAIDGNHLAQMALANRYFRGISLGRHCEVALTFYQKLATHVISKITQADGELVQRFRLSDFEEHPTRHLILIDRDLLQQYQVQADLGNQQAQYSLGVLYYLRGIDFDKASHYLHLAAEKGNSHAWAYLGKLYARNTSIEQHQEKAVKYFQLAAVDDNPIGQTGLGVAYYYGAGIEQSYENALKLFHRAANQSHGEAQLMLGIMHAHGISVPRNDELAFKWFQAAARSGHILGFNNLGSMHATGTGVLPSCPLACDFYKNVAERGSWSQMFNEAFRLYRRGKIPQAFRIYLYLAELGYEIAQTNVAYMLERMPDQLSSTYRSEEQRYGKALLYWNRAARQGYHDAHIRLGDYYYYGLGTPVNYTLAVRHYKHASEQGGNAQGTFNLGYMQEKGLGSKRNLSAAQRFYRMTMERDANAYYPAVLAVTKARLEAFFEDFNLSARIFTTGTIDARQASDDADYSVWDLFFITFIAGLMSILFRIRRNRAA